MSFSITVLLSVTLFMSSTTSQLPPTSVDVPYVTQFLTTLIAVNILSVIATVGTVFIHHTKEKTESKQGFPKTFKKVAPAGHCDVGDSMNNCTGNIPVKEPQDDTDNQLNIDSQTSRNKISPYKPRFSVAWVFLYQNLDMMLFASFLMAWAITTITFLCLLFS